MAGAFYTIFDTMAGRCGIVWGLDGILAVQLAESREIDTRRRLLRQCPDARESRPTIGVEGAIEGIATALRGAPWDFSDVVLDLGGIPAFDCRVYDIVRAIPRGETATYAEIAKRAGSSGALHAVGHAIRSNPFAMIVPCHRVLQVAGDTTGVCANGGGITRRRLLSLEGALTTRGPSLFDVLLTAGPRQADSRQR
ncbi:methylated-DNA--[protein]-cysteine S-methyltransferase [Rhodopseudomonas pseudopalustris]|uniref:Methylated-DNA--protein-cysteine methyltransferase n=2 Tax=Rhodopseudomonas TaxID=1073 RepID=Q13CP2_RHOPS|nr:methylated-DNA--[protein]-cysteine S-methyltransferase [Rhodopseudomonas pseudopalustris]ABE38147.1 methylated-DNA--protein-cysteine methyltransferase [Rhodopseudomonas palustris BisB5]MBB1090667.1 methylated-DNA--[protein]-cysteine S-methyltransferase [Rhodopseudomonas palustris]SEO93924.1 methylated-DNA-[protein]-cysteine S-methyltransferase [Rhodopseudomonas pseudopalustris]